MEAQINWYKKWYESQYQLFFEDQQIGEISPVAFSSRTMASLKGQKYIFRPKGFLLRKIDILDARTMEQLGEIYFMGIGIKGIIALNSKETFQLRCENILTARWTISRSRQELITYTGNHISGKIRATVPDQLLLVAGLYASIFQWRKLGLLIIIFVPLILILIRTI